MRKDFSKIDIYDGIVQKDGAKWIKDNGIVENWKTPEHIEVRPVYTKEDLEGMEHLDFTAGIPPYLRGPYSMGVECVLSQEPGQWSEGTECGLRPADT